MPSVANNVFVPLGKVITEVSSALVKVIVFDTVNVFGVVPFVTENPVIKPVTSSPVFVPDTEASNPTVNVFDVVPPAIVNPTVCEARVKAFTDVGVIAPKVKVIAGVVVDVATEPETPLAVVTDTDVTVPEPDTVAQLAVLPSVVKYLPELPV